MANQVTVRFRSYLPGSGWDSAGSAKQGKQEVRGIITVTDYVRNGEDLVPVDLGLTTIDHLDLVLQEPLTSNDPSEQWRKVDYSYSAAQFYVVEIGQTGVALNIGATKDPVITFSAFGDSSHDVELL